MVQNILTYAVIIISCLLLAKTLLGSLENRGWFLYLLSIPRFQYVLIGVVLFVLLAFLSPWWSIVPFVTTVINIFAGRNTNVDKVPSGATSQLRVIFANLFVANLNYERIASSIKSSEADVIVLAEIMEDTFQELKKRIPEYNIQYFDTSPRTLGSAIFVKNKQATFHSEYFSNPKAATLVADIKLGEKELRILGYHTDAPLTPTKYKALKKEVAGLAAFAEKETKPLLLIGDFNDTSQTALFQMLFKAGLKDFRKPFERGVTWPLFLPKFLRLTFDNALVKNNAHVVKREFGERTGSDHIPIIVDVAIQ